MSLPPGTRFGPYRIDAPLGAGGMGEVYRATDTRLPRPVAIKVLLASVSDDPSRRARFEREARTIGTLNHPHICTLFDIGEHDGRSFIVMELVEGDTLARRIERGALPLEDALRYGVEIAGALDRAHRQGIVHRDLKPANIMITKTGVKLLDFGLAKYKPGAAGSESLLPTRAADGTAEGSILGTLQYMSPEQLEAREADARSDIFAFGAVLYEMVTGRKAFTGASQASLIGAILRDQPAAMTSLQPLAPASLDRIVATCLQKDPDERWQSAGDVARELKWVADEARLAKSGVTAAAGGAGRATSAWPLLRPWWLIAAGLALVVLSLATGWMLRRPPAPQPPWILTRLTTDAGLSDYPTLSPDGKLVAYSSDRSADGRLDLYVKQVAGGQPIQLTTDGAGNTMPDFSPDGSRVVFRSGRDGGGIYEVSALGGDPRLVAQGGFNPKYSPDGSQVAYWVGAPSIAPAVPGSGTVWVARLSGGAPKQVGSHFTTARSPLWSPDGASLLVLGYTSKQAYEPSSIDWWLVPVSGGDAVRTGAHALLQRMGIRAARVSTGPRIAPRAELSPPLCWSRATGTVVFPAALGDADDLWEVPISASSGLASGPVTRLTTSASREVHVACTPSGTIAFTDLEARDDVWLLAAGLDSNRLSDAPQRITREPADREHAALSRTGQHVAFASNQSGWLNIWIKNLLTGRESIVADSPVLQRFPVLDATGTRVAYSSLEPEKRAIHVSTVGGVPQRVCDDCLRATDWSADGKSLLIFRGSPYEISTLDLASHRQTLLLKHPTHHLLYGRFSPDGHWVSFTERIDEIQGRIVVAPVDGPTPVPESAWIRIADGEQDDWANWSPDGRTLYFTSSRDGHSCLWGQRIADATRQPTGDPFPVLHLHGRVTYKRGGWSSAAGRIAIVLAEETGNIWMMSRPSSR